MIHLTRLNGHEITVNCDLIKFIESVPDTAICLITGERLLVRESPEAVVTHVVVYRSGILAHTWPDAATALSATAQIKCSEQELSRNDHA